MSGPQAYDGPPQGAQPYPPAQGGYPPPPSGAPQQGGYAPPPNGQPGGYQQGGYPQQGGYQQQGGYPQQGGGYPQPGAYPAPPMNQSGPKVAAPWTGALMALGGLIAGIAAFLVWAKSVFNSSVISGTVSITGMGSVSGTGDPRLRNATDTSNVNDGKVTLVLGILLIVLALLVFAKKGRVWVGIVGVVFAVVIAYVGFANLGTVSDDNKKIKALEVGQNFTAHVDTGIGLWLTIVGGLLALIGAIAAIAARRRVAA